MRRIRRFWQPLYYIEHFFMGDRLWGYLRFAVFLLILFIFIQMGRSAYEPEEMAQVSILSARRLRYVIMPVAAVIIGFLVGAHYIRDIYELEGFSLGLRYLRAVLFSNRLPRLDVRDGEMILDEDQSNLLDIIGGPGYVNIFPGNVVLFERLDRPSNVRADGIHFVSRMESVKETISLDDQHGFVESVSATTRDGIEVLVRDIKFRFRLRSGNRLGSVTERNVIDPYPYSVNAVYNMGYRRIVSPSGISSWHDTVTNAVRASITEYISRTNLDQLTAPGHQDKDPRLEISKSLLSPGTRERLKNIGAELLWFDIGHFDVPEPAKKQRLETWGAKWVGDARVVRAQGEAQAMALEELGRAEAQAEMLMSIIHALDGVDLSDNTSDNLQKIIVARTAQLLDALVDDQEHQKPGEDAGENR